MKTDDLILKLSSDLKKPQLALGQKAFLGYWCMGVLLLLLPALWFVPIREDLNVRIHEIRFWLETTLCLIAAALSAVMVYRSAFPGLLKRTDQRWAFFPLAILALFWLGRMSGASFGHGLESEMSFYRGRCGALIFMVGMLSGAGFFAWARRAAPTALGTTGLWSAVSAGCLGAFSMQFICDHDNGLHLWIWHALPVVALAWLGAWAGQRWLRWSAPKASG